MQKVIQYLVPNTRVQMVWKLPGYCALIVVWSVTWNWYISEQDPRGASELIADALAVGTPFAAIFAAVSWKQARDIRALNIRARIDPLSGLLNRQTFFRRFRRAMRGTRTGLLLLIDADHFKNVNDLYGHAAGDRCIAAIGHRLNWHMRDVDLAGRVGGEEFAVFLSNVAPAHGRAVAERIGQPVTFSDGGKNEHISVTLSIGAVWMHPDISDDALMIEADEALYQAKTTGRAKLVFHGDGEVISLGRRRADKISRPDANRRRVTSRTNNVA